MAEKDIDLKRKVGDSFDDIHPTTKWANIKDKPNTFTPTTHYHKITDADGVEDLEDAKIAIVLPGNFPVEEDRFKINKANTLPIKSDGTRFLCENGTWQSVSGGSASGSWELLRARDADAPLTNVNSGTTTASVSLTKNISPGDVLAIELSTTSQAIYNSVVLTITVQILSSNPNHNYDYNLESFTSWTGTELRVNNFSISASGMNLYFGNKKCSKGSFSGSAIEWTANEDYTLYVGRVWRLVPEAPQEEAQEDEWQAPSNWYDIRDIVDNDTEEYSGKVGVLYKRKYGYTTTPIPVKTVGAVKAKTSDGSTYTGNITQHYWNTSKDSAGGTYYVIYYFDGTSKSFNGSLYTEAEKNNLLWFHFGGSNNFRFTNFTMRNSSSTTANLEAVTKNENVILSMTSGNRAFYGCKSLTSIPQLDTSAMTDGGSMFEGCSSLTSIPPLDTSAMTSGSFMFYNCSSLTSIPQLDTSAMTSGRDMFNGCKSLTRIPRLDTSAMTNGLWMFRSCSSLGYIGTPLNLSSLTSTTDLASYVYNQYVEVNISFVENTISQSITIEFNMTIDSLQSLINGLVDLTGEESKNLVIGNNNIAKLTEAQKNAISDKNWTYE